MINYVLDINNNIETRLYCRTADTSCLGWMVTFVYSKKVLSLNPPESMMKLNLYFIMLRTKIYIFSFNLIIFFWHSKQNKYFVQMV